MIYVYAGYYMKGKAYYGRFFMILTLFMAAMLGLVLANNWLTVLVFWELTSITSFLLIGYEHEKKKARYAAWQGLLVTSFGGLALLAGLVLITIVTGEYTISELSNFSDTLQSSTLYLPILLCVALGAFTKSAQVPFHFWLPNAMAAPTPVSAFLHSATMVKAGIYFLARFSPIIGNTIEWQILLCATGGLTMLTGAIMAFKSDNLKKLLAYSTISALGIMVLSFGLGTEAAVYAGLAYIIAHALYKSTLFMLAGIIDKQAGTKKISELPRNLYKKMPAAFILVTLAALSFGGIAPFFGFVAKEMLMEMVLHAPFFSSILVIVMVLTGTFFVTLLLILAHSTFFKKKGKAGRNIIAGGTIFYLAPLVTALAGLYFGLFPDQLSELLSNAAATFANNIPEKHLALWHGWNMALALSILSIIAGLGLYWAKIAFNWKPKAGFLSLIYPSNIYQYLFNGVIKLGEWQTRKIQTGYLRYYAMFTLFTILLLAGFTFFYKAGIRINTSTIDVYLIDLILGIIALLALAYTLFSPSKIDSLLSLSIVGIAISIIFFTSGAPDLAITFFLIDTLTVTVFVLILHKLPKKIIPKTTIARYRDAFISLGIGLLITLILFSITYDPLTSRLKQFYAENSYNIAKGKNMVNVILVDFRVLDTFGEITVLAIGALGVFALVNYSKKNTIL
ncbi:Na(+)/H(+) antiporter subunit A [Marivirga lumbricoides]|uniref:Na(+)/H(+) antiporter subunit A n=2 Tax=Marivirga lumbricoides TaxID=1046115 RepID=A0ABQ1M3K6_9BACT|nr:Na(+)/H(+) antiporter subunit A [Marivirga lumbricoides]